MAEGWRPLSARGAGPDEHFDALHEGVPPWIEASVLDWIRAQYRYLDGGFHRYRVPLIREFERRSRTHVGGLNPAGAFNALMALAMTNPDGALDVIDFTVFAAGRSRTPSTDRAQEVARIDSILEEGGSAWKVRWEPGASSGLQRRLPEAVTASIAATISSSGRAGQHLLTAWNAAYGRSPASSTAYREAVRAVEAVAAPIALPNDPRATLGTVIANFRDARSQWQLVLQPSHGVDGVETVQHMLETLWRSQFDRHGTADESVPLNVSIDEARAAVHLAATLVQWFASGAVRRV